MRSPANSNGITLIELLLVASLMGALFVLASQALRGNQSLWRQAITRHALESDQAAAVELISGLLRRADPLTVVIDSTEMGPWSRLSFASSGRAYRIYGSQGTLWIAVDQQEPKPLSKQLSELHFVTQHSHLPTVLTWNLTLGVPGRDGHASTLSFTSKQFLPLPAE